MKKRNRVEAADFPLKPGSSMQNGFGPASGDIATPEGTLLAEKAGLDGSLWRLFFYPLDAIGMLDEALAELAANTPHASPFYHPLCLAAGMHRICPPDTHLIVLWETIGGEQKARLMLPVAQERSGWRDHLHLEALSSPLMPVTDPLLNGTLPAETLAAFTELCREAFTGGLPPLRLGALNADSAFAVLGDQPEVTGIAIAAQPAGARTAMSRMNRSQRKETREVGLHREELAKMGGTSYERASSPMDVLLRFEEFLLLESSGRRGNGSLPLHRLKRMAAFARQTVYGLAGEGRCEIFTLRLSGRAIASLVMFRSGGSWFAWKLAVSGRYRMFRPDLVLVDSVTGEISDEDGFESIEDLGLKVPGLREIWPGETRQLRLVLASTPDVAGALAKGDAGTGLISRLRGLFQQAQAV